MTAIDRAAFGAWDLSGRLDQWIRSTRLGRYYHQLTADLNDQPWLAEPGDDFCPTGEVRIDGHVVGVTDGDTIKIPVPDDPWGEDLNWYVPPGMTRILPDPLLDLAPDPPICEDCGTPSLAPLCTCCALKANADEIAEDDAMELKRGLRDAS